MTIIEQFTGREAGPLIQFIKYGIAGGIATLTHIALFHILAWKILPALQENDFAVRKFHIHVPEMSTDTRARNSMLDNFMGFLVSNFVAYIINIYWVFEKGRHSLLVELGMFYLASGISMAIGTFLMGYLIKRYGIRTTYAFFSNLVTAVLINYAARKFLIFKG